MEKKNITFYRHVKVFNDSDEDPEYDNRMYNDNILSFNTIIQNFGIPSIIFISPYEACRITAYDFIKNLESFGCKSPDVYVLNLLCPYIRNVNADITKETAAYDPILGENLTGVINRVENLKEFVHDHILNLNCNIHFITHSIIMNLIIKHFIKEKNDEKYNFYYLEGFSLETKKISKESENLSYYYDVREYHYKKENKYPKKQFNNKYHKNNKFKKYN